MVLGLLLSMSGCLMLRPESQPIHTYQLSLGSESQKQEMGRTNSTGAILLVGLPQASPGFDTQQMVYLTRPYEVNYFSANQWIDTPARMLTPLLITTLEKTRMWRAVVTAPSTLRADYRVDVTGLVLAQEFWQSPSQVRFAWRAQLIDLPKGQVLGTHRFEARQEALSEDAYGGVRAANQILGGLLNEMVLWLETCVNEPRKAPC